MTHFYIMNFAVFLAIIAISLCQKQSLNIAIRQSEITTVKNQMLPVLTKNLSDMTIADMSFASGSLKCTMSNVHVRLGALDASKININLVPGTNTIKSNGNGIGAVVTAHTKCSYLFITVEPDVTVTLKDVGYSGTVTMTSNTATGKPVFNLGALTITISTSNMDIVFSNTPIKVILDLLVPLLKSQIISTVNDMAKTTIPDMVNSMIGGMIDTMPVDIEFYNGLGVHSVMARSPLCEDDKLVIYSWTYGVYLKSPKVPTYSPKDMPDFSTCSQGIQVIISEYVPDSLLFAAYYGGLLIDSAEIDYNGVKGTFSCVTNDIPDFTFVNDIAIKYYGTCEFKGTFNGKAVAVKAAGMLVGDGDARVQNEKIFFSIQELIPTVTNIYSISGMTAAEFTQLVNQYANGLEDDINNGIGKNGIALPMIDGIDYSNSVSAMKNGYMEVCSTPIINITSTYMN
jgi:hypothetical protein